MAANKFVNLLEFKSSWSIFNKILLSWNVLGIFQNRTYQAFNYVLKTALQTYSRLLDSL